MMSLDGTKKYLQEVEQRSEVSTSDCSYHLQSHVSSPIRGLTIIGRYYLAVDKIGDGYTHVRPPRDIYLLTTMLRGWSRSGESCGHAHMY